MVKATYVQVWWPSFDQAVYVDRLPVWADGEYVDPQTGAALPSWDEAVAAAELDRPAHVMRFGTQLDMAGIIAPSEDADRAVRYLTKYVAKSIADTYADPDADPAELDPGYAAHVARLHAELRFLPCSERCANWLRYGCNPMAAGLAWSRASVTLKPTTGTTSGWAVAASWSPASGPARRCGSS